jgi:hypothetical protein
MKMELEFVKGIKWRFSNFKNPGQALGQTCG